MIVSVLSFYSCTDSNPVENEIVTTKSISLRTTLNEFKKENNISGRSSSTIQNVTPCFSFVFPITLSYNNGTTITVSSLDGLIQVLTNETNVLYIDGIEFPFQVQTGSTLTTINNEADFFCSGTSGSLLTYCRSTEKPTPVPHSKMNIASSKDLTSSTGR